MIRIKSTNDYKVVHVYTRKQYSEVMCSNKRIKEFSFSNGEKTYSVERVMNDAYLDIPSDLKDAITELN